METSLAEQIYQIDTEPLHEKTNNWGFNQKPACTVSEDG